MCLSELLHVLLIITYSHDCSNGDTSNAVVLSVPGVSDSHVSVLLSLRFFAYR